MSPEVAPERPWKHIAALAIWLCLVPPVGLWKLWDDRTLSAGTKWRILIYLFFVPALIYVTVSLWTTNHALTRLMP